VSGFLADRFPKNRLLAAGYALATLMALCIMFLPIGLGTLALVFMLGGIQVAIEETLFAKMMKAFALNLVCTACE
jgi:MFS family permease